MKKSRIVSLLLMLCLVFGMFAGCSADKGSEGTGSKNNSSAVDEGEFDDPFDE